MEAKYKDKKTNYKTNKSKPKLPLHSKKEKI